MTTRSNPNRLFDLWRRRPAEHLSEPADVGTAFGMELSLMPDDEGPAPRSGSKPAAAGWLRRLTRWPGH